MGQNGTIVKIMLTLFSRELCVLRCSISHREPLLDNDYSFAQEPSPRKTPLLDARCYWLMVIHLTGGLISTVTSFGIVDIRPDVFNVVMSEIPV